MDNSKQVIAVIGIPRKLGAVPQPYKTFVIDNFNFDGILSAIDKVGNVVDKASNVANQVSSTINKAGQVVQTVKDATGQVKQIVSKPAPTSGYQYSVPLSPQAGGLQIDGNVALMVGGSVLLLIVVVLLTR